MKVKTATWYTATPIEGGTAFYLGSQRSSTLKGINDAVAYYTSKEGLPYLVVKHEAKYINDRTSAMMARVANGGEAWAIEVALSEHPSLENVTLSKEC
jgi:hypothetical protein